LYNLLHEIKRRDEKAIIFANYVRPLEFAIQGWNYLYPEESNSLRFIHGSINSTIRERLYCEFRTEPSVPFLFSTLKLGNRGLNLIEGNHVIFIQPWYRWSHIEQGIYRCFRIGQKRIVFAHFLLSQNTSDERIFQKAKQLGIDNQNAMVSDSALASDDPDDDNDENVDISSFF
jgi:non-specific serine/threonine protein kinase